MTMPAISLHQPWASLVAVGAKKIETRSWKPSLVLEGERIAIHAAQKLYSDPGSDFNNLVAKYLGDDWEETVPRGEVVATATLMGRFRITRMDLPEGDELSLGDYASGRWGWRLADVAPLDPPKPARGYQGIWTWRE